MLKSKEHEKTWGYLNYASPNLQNCSEVRSDDPQISFYHWILRIGGPGE